MKERHFLTKRRLVSGTMQSTAIIECGGCGEEGVHVNTSRTRLPPDYLTKLFIAKGWSMGRTSRRDRCPACVQKKTDDRRAKVPEQTREVRNDSGTEYAVSKNGNVTLMNPSERLTETNEVPDMDRDTRRLIFGDIDILYHDAERGYLEGTTDQSIADSLGIRVEWVKQVRVEYFGPAEGNRRGKAVAQIQERDKVLNQEIKAVVETLAGLIKDAHEIGELIKTL